jgi:hypothetical protein
MIGFLPKPLDTLGKNVVGDSPFQNDEKNVIVHIFRIETPSRSKRKAAEVPKSSFKDSLKAQDAMMRHNPSKPKIMTAPTDRLNTIAASISSRAASRYIPKRALPC